MSVAPRPEPQGPTPEEELPDWVMSSVLRFMEPFFAGRGPASYGFGPGYGYTQQAPRNFVMEIERTCQIPVPWQNGPNGAANGVWQQMYQDRALAIRVLDYALGEVMLGYEGQDIEPAVRELNRAFQQAGANYVVVQPDPKRVRYRLERRTIPAAAAAARAQTSLPGNASNHLSNAWSAAFGREPSPSTAYSEAVKAVEAAAIPVVLPNDPLATPRQDRRRASGEPLEVLGRLRPGRVARQGRQAIAVGGRDRSRRLTVEQPDRQARSGRC